MENFVFKNPTKIIFGKGTISAIEKEIPKNAKIMMTYGGGSIKKNGVYDQVMAALKGRKIIEFGGIEANPVYETLMKGVEIARKEGIDFLLAVGGGSVIDGTKFIACAVNYKGSDPWDFMDNFSIIANQLAVPLATVLTLPATGSEMNNGSVVSRKSTQEKLCFYHPHIYPQFSVLDPEVCYSLPKKQVANGVVDAYVHVLEQYMIETSDAMIQDRFSEGILQTLYELGPRLAVNHQDYSLVSNYMWAATMALNQLIAVGVKQDWATHRIGHELTALHGLDHGVTLAIIYPSLMNVMRETKGDKIVQYAERVLGITTGDKQSKIDEAIKKTAEFFEKTGIKTHLSDYGVSDENFEIIVERFRKRGWNLGEGGLVTPDKVQIILEGAK